MVRKPETIAFWYGNLPHWEVAKGRYFVTIHLAGAIPRQGQDRIRELAAGYAALPGSDADGRLKVHRRIYAEMECWLDRSEYAVHLQHPAIARMVMDAIDFRQGKSWNMFNYVVMPSHLHLFFELLHEGLKDTLEQFKRWTGHQASQLLNLESERFWQDEWFDHWSRSDEEDEKIDVDIRQNPEKAKLVKTYRDWPYGSWSGPK
jgi:hypothetical protein